MKAVSYTHLDVYKRQGLDPLIYPNVNWYDELFRSGAMNQNINVTIRGGSKKLDYFRLSLIHISGGMG